MNYACTSAVLIKAKSGGFKCTNELPNFIIEYYSMYRHELCMH